MSELEEERMCELFSYCTCLKKGRELRERGLESELGAGVEGMEGYEASEVEAALRSGESSAMLVRGVGGEGKGETFRTWLSTFFSIVTLFCLMP